MTLITLMVERTSNLWNKLGHFVFFLKLGFTPCEVEQPLQGMELQEKEAQKD